MAIAHINAKEVKQELINKRTMRRICENYETKLHRLQVEEEKFVALSIDEKAEIDRLTRLLTKQKLLTYKFTALGTVIGSIITWLIA